MTSPNQRGPRPLGDVLGDLFAIRGLARLRARQELEAAWTEAVGEAYARETRVDEAKGGVLHVTVANSSLLAELAGFRKAELLAAMRANARGSSIRDLRFRLGKVNPRA